MTIAKSLFSRSPRVQQERGQASKLITRGQQAAHLVEAQLEAELSQPAPPYPPLSLQSQKPWEPQFPLKTQFENHCWKLCISWIYPGRVCFVV